MTPSKANTTDDESADERTIEAGDNLAYRDDIKAQELCEAMTLSASIDSYDNLERRLYQIDGQFILAVRHDASSTPTGPKDIIVEEVGTDIQTNILGINKECDWILDENAPIYDARWPSDLHLSILLDGFTDGEIKAMSAESELNIAVEVNLV